MTGNKRGDIWNYEDQVERLSRKGQQVQRSSKFNYHKMLWITTWTLRFKKIRKSIRKIKTKNAEILWMRLIQITFQKEDKKDTDHPYYHPYVHLQQPRYQNFVPHSQNLLRLLEWNFSDQFYARTKSRNEVTPWFIYLCYNGNYISEALQDYQGGRFLTCD